MEGLCNQFFNYFYANDGGSYFIFLVSVLFF